MTTHRLSATLGKTAAIVLAMTAFSVEAATNLNSSRSNIYREVAGAWDDAACLKAGGNCGSCVPELKRIIASELAPQTH